jgi:hypothetical protein
MLGMNWLQEAVEINNHEASILQRPSKRPEQEAIPALQRAVTVMRQFHHCLHQAMDTAPPRTAVIQGRDAVSAAVVAFALERDDERADGYSTGHGFVYHRLLLVSTRLQHTNLTNVDDLEAVGLMVSTTCLFNLALSWHGLALQATTASSLEQMCLALSKAEQFYRLILTVLEHPECGHGCDDSYAVLKYLVLNNRAQLYYAQGDHVSAQDCRNALCNLLVTGGNELLDECLGPKVTKELKLNLLHWKIPTVALAA